MPELSRERDGKGSFRKRLRPYDKLALYGTEFRIVRHLNIVTAKLDPDGVLYQWLSTLPRHDGQIHPRGNGPGFVIPQDEIHVVFEIRQHLGLLRYGDDLSSEYQTDFLSHNKNLNPRRRKSGEFQ